MKINFPCADCQLDYKQEIRTEIDINNNGIYELNCINSHNNTYYVENDKYQILFDLGILAANDSFYRESVSSFAASLERFYEYCIMVMLISRETDISDINKTWKHVSKMSERQIGAFYILYLSTFNDVPIVFDNKMIQFRNAVIHKGYIPTKEEVLKYANEVYSYIVSCLMTFKEQHRPSMNNYSLMRKSEAIKNHNDRSSIATCIIGTTIDDNFTENKLDFKKAAYILTESYYPIYRK